MSDSAKRGFRIFEGKAGCDSCHTTRGPGGRFLSDGSFHNTGVAMTAAPRNLGTFPEIAILARNAGRQAMSFSSRHSGAFKTPTLRDVAKRPPYMHDGRFATLHDVVDYYRGQGNPNGSTDVAIIDIIVGHCGANPGAAWIDQTGPTRAAGTIGRSKYPR